MNRIKLYNRIFFQQARNALLIGVVLAIFASAAQLISDLSVEQQRISLEITLLLDAEEVSAAQAAYRLDEGISKNIVQRLVRSPFVYKASLDDNFGSTIASALKGGSEARTLSGALASAIKIEELHGARLFSGKEKMYVGTLRAYIDKAAIADALIKNIRTVVMGRLITVTTLFALLLFVFYFTITKPIVGVIDRVSAIEPRELESVRIPVPGAYADNELGLLITAVNGLLNRIGEQTEELRISEAEKALILDNAGEIIAYHDADHHIQWVNKAYLDATGLSLAEIKGKKCYHAWGLDRLCNGCPVTRSMQSREPQRGELTPANQPHWPADHGSWSVSAAPVKDASGKIVGAIEIAHDITEQKKAEEELARYRHHLEELVRARTKELEEANKELDAFSYSVAHDLKAPLRVLDGFSGIVVKDYGEKLDENGKRSLEYIRANAKRMGQLIDDLLSFSHLSRKELATEPVDMWDIVRSVSGELKEAFAQGRDVNLDIKELPPANGDPAMLRQAWMNLISNAIKFTRRRTSARIEVGSMDAESETVYYVKDNGVGFSMEHVNKLFGVFQRLHGQDEFEGTGVGLAIVQKVAQRHGGRAWAEGRLDEGATFYFSLPKRRLHGTG